MAALHLAIATLMGAGDHIVASASLYGGTINLLTLTLPRFGITTTFVKPRDHDGFARRDPPEDPAGHRRDHRQSRPRSARHPGGRRDRACGRHSAADRQHLRHAVSVPADRARRRHRHAFGHQMDRRPWRRHRRRARRRRPLRLAGIGQVPDADRALCRLSRHRSSPRSSARRPSSCGRAPRACAISAPACRRPTPSICCRASRRCRCAWQRHMENTRGRARLPAASIAAVDWVLHPVAARPSRSRAGASACCRKGAGSIVSFGIKGGRAAGRKFIEALRLVEPSRQCRRRQDAGDPSGQHHASADGCRGARGRRRRRGADPPLGRARGGERHHRRSRRRRCAPRSRA